MIHVIKVKNPFDVRDQEEYYEEWAGKAVRELNTETGEKVYSINGIIVDDTEIPTDGDEIVIMPKIEKKAFGWILTIGLTVLSAGVASGASWALAAAHWGLWTRIGVSMALTMLGNYVGSALTPTPKIDISNTEQSNTYGWGVMQSLTGQGQVLPVVYGTVKTAGMMLQRHVVSDGTKQYLNVLYCLAEGPIDGIDHIKINGNDLENFEGIEIDKRLGDAVQDIIPNFNDSYADTGLAYELNPGKDWSTVTLDGNTAQAIEVTVSFPQGLYYSNDSGNPDWTSVTIEAQYKKVGDIGWKQIPIKSENTSGEGTIRAKETKAFYRVWGVRDLEPAQYEVRMRCTAKANTTIRCANKIQWSGVTQIIYDDFSYPGKALLGVKALATDQLNSSDPQMTCEVTRSKAYVWNPISNAYEEKPANNPAWACYDILHHCVKYGERYEVYGVPKECMDYYAFEAWANNCEKEHIEFNYLYDSAMQLTDALTYPARVGMGSIIIVGTKYSCVYDSPAVPSQLFTVANIKKGSFREEFQGASERANAIEISYINKDKDYERDVLTVFDDSYDSADAYTQPTQVELMGCTSTKQAYKYGKRKLRSNKYEIRTISFDAFTDAIACSIGQVILVQHDLTDWGCGGRVVAVEGKTVTLNQEIPADCTIIRVRDNTTNDLHETSIKSIEKDKVVVEDAAGFSEDAVFTAGTNQRDAKQFRVISLEKNDSEITRTITAVEYYPELYDSDLDKMPAITQAPEKIDPPRNLMLKTENILKATGETEAVIHCSWLPPRLASQVVIEASNDGENYVRIAALSLSETECSFETMPNIVCYVRAYSTNDIGAKSSYCEANIQTDGRNNPGQVSNVKAYSRYREIKDGISRYDIVVSWNKPVYAGYAGAQVWYKTNHMQGEQLVFQEGVLADELGFCNDWQFGGEGFQSVIIPQATVGDTYRICVVAKDFLGAVANRDEAPTIDVLVAIKTTTPNTPSGLSVTFSDAAYVTWQEVTNSDIAFYELRLDKFPGKETSKLLGRTNGLSMIPSLQYREGNLYLYACSAQGKYSYPAELKYSKPAPIKPKAPTLATKLGGFSISADKIPTGCLGMNVYIEGNQKSESLVSPNNLISYMCNAGIYDVTVAYYDLFGEGEKSNASHVVVKATVDASLLEDESVSLEKVNAAIKKIFEEDIPNTAAAVSVITDNLNKEDGYKEYSALTQLQDDINLRVVNGDKITQINLTKDVLSIQGKLIHITGDTLFDDSVIVSNMLAANAVTAEKLCINDGDTANGYINISKNLIEVFDNNGVRRVRLGVWDES